MSTILADKTRPSGSDMVLPGLAVSEGASRVVIADGAVPLTANGVLGPESMTTLFHARYVSGTYTITVGTPDLPWSHATCGALGIFREAGRWDVSATVELQRR